MPDNDPNSFAALDAVLAGMNNPAPAPAAPAPIPDPTPAPAPTPDPAPAAPTPEPTPAPTPEPTPTPAPTPTPTPAPAPANDAFARMRIENSQLQKTMKDLGQLLGIDGKVTGEQLQKAVNDRILEAQAKAQNVPVELLKRLEAAESDAAEFRRVTQEQKAFAAYDAIQKEYGLTTDELVAFAQQLDQQGINPFVDGSVDLMKEYRSRNIDRIVDARVNAKMAEFIKTQQAAAAQGTRPVGATGAPAPAGTSQVNTVQELNALLGSLGK